MKATNHLTNNGSDQPSDHEATQRVNHLTELPQLPVDYGRPTTEANDANRRNNRRP